MARICCLLAALTLLPVLPVLSWPDIITRIERGAAASDEAALRTAIDDARAFADAAGLDRERQIALLGGAYAANRLAGLQGVEPAESSALLQRAEKDLGEVIKADPKSVEARVLLAAVYGSMIRFGGNAIELGPGSQNLLSDALKLEPNNPRVHVQIGMNTYHTPAEYGGGLDKAEASFRQALVLFEHEPVGRPWPNWGRFDAHVWLGQALAARGDKAGARAEYMAALQLWPQSGFVKYKLLPMLNK
jgi:tetratricopeptide (TPR) repeat protein